MALRSRFPLLSLFIVLFFVTLQQFFISYRAEVSCTYVSKNIAVRLGGRAKNRKRVIGLEQLVSANKIGNTCRWICKLDE